MGRLLGCHRDGQRLWVGQADVLGGEDDQPARDEHHVLACLEHAGHPVDGRVGVAAADALDEGGHDVVVLVAGPVVEEVALLHGALDMVEADRRLAGQRGRRLEPVEGNPGVAACDFEQRVHRVAVDRGVQLGQASLHHLLQLLALQRLQAEDAAARKERRDDLERGVFGGGADQGDRPILDVGQDRVLLCLVEAVDLVDEEHGAQTRPPVDLGFGHHLAQVGHARGHGGHGHHPGAGLGGQQAGQRRLAAPRRSPQHDAGQVARAGQLPEDVHHLSLADQVVELPGPHPGRERCFGHVPGGEGKELALICH